MMDGWAAETIWYVRTGGLRGCDNRTIGSRHPTGDHARHCRRARGSDGLPCLADIVIPGLDPGIQGGRSPKQFSRDAASPVIPGR